MKISTICHSHLHLRTLKSKVTCPITIEWYEQGFKTRKSGTVPILTPGLPCLVPRRNGNLAKLFIHTPLHITTLSPSLEGAEGALQEVWPQEMPELFL